MFAEFLERTLRQQLHPHWSDAAFDTERLVDSRVLLETDVQLGGKGEEAAKENKDQFHGNGKKAWCLLALSYLVSLFLCEVSHTFQLYEDLVMRI